MKDGIQAALRSDKAEPKVVASRQYGYISILNIAIVMALGVLLYIVFSIFFGTSLKEVLPYSSDQEVNTPLPHSDNGINTDDRANNLNYSSDFSQGVSNTKLIREFNSQSDNRKQSQQSNISNSLPAERNPRIQLRSATLAYAA